MLKQRTLPDVVGHLLEAQRLGSGYQKLEAHYWHGIALWERERYDDAMHEFKETREISVSMGRSDSKQIRYISGMNEQIPKLYIGSGVERGSRIAWLICNPSGVRVFINPNSIPEREFR